MTNAQRAPRLSDLKGGLQKTAVIERETAMRGALAVLKARRFRGEIHADAYWTIPKALCNIDAPIQPEHITRDNEKVTCAECREVLDWIRLYGSMGNK